MADPSPADTVAPSDDEARRQQLCAQRWIGEIGIAEKSQRSWLERAKKIARRYKDESGDLSYGTARKRRFAILWSNTQITLPATYSKPPTPVVARRFADPDPVARATSEILERCLNYSIDVQDLDGVLSQAALDYVLLARGQLWERYKPTFGPQVIPQIALQVKTMGGEDPEYQDASGNVYKGDQVKTNDEGGYYADGDAYRPVTFEESVSDYVNWEDFLHSPGRTWDEVPWVGRRVYLTRKQCIERFGEKLGRMVPLDWGPVAQGKRDLSAEMQKKAAVYEIWDKTEMKVFWISKSWNSRPLDERPDPLGIPGFFPCPRPLLGTTANDTCIPIPDYVYYQDQAEEIDSLTARITQLQEALKVRGFYAASDKTNLNNLLAADNNMLIPVPDWMSFKDGGGVANKIEWWPIAQVVAALEACVEQRQLLVNDVYQITGIADIMRGMNDPRATATAERIKGAWGTLRVRSRQLDVMRFARDQLRIKGAVIASKFDVETLKAMSGVKLPTNAEKQAVQQQLMQQAAQAQMLAQVQAQPQMAPGGVPGAPQGPMGHNGGPPMPPPEPTDEQQMILQSPSWEDVMGLLRNNAMRQFRIDIETDSTIEPNESEEKAQIVELLQAAGAFIAQWGPAVAAQPDLAPMAAALFKSAVRRFRAGRELEEIIDSTVDKLSAAAGQAQQPGQPAEKPDNSLAVATVKGQADIQREQIKQQGEDGRAQLQAQVDAGQQALEADEMKLKLIVGGRDQEPQVTV